MQNLGNMVVNIAMAFPSPDTLLLVITMDPANLAPPVVSG